MHIRTAPLVIGSLVLGILAGYFLAMPGLIGFALCLVSIFYRLARTTKSSDGFHLLLVLCTIIMGSMIVTAVTVRILDTSVDLSPLKDWIFR